MGKLQIVAVTTLVASVFAPGCIQDNTDPGGGANCGEGTTNINGVCQVDPALSIVYDQTSSEYWSGYYMGGMGGASCVRINLQFANSGTSSGGGSLRNIIIDSSARFTNVCKADTLGTIHWTETSTDSLAFSGGTFTQLSNIATNVYGGPVTAFTCDLTGPNGTLPYYFSLASGTP
jgi:hypothetical protein